MINVKYIVFAKQVIIDVSTNSLSMIGVYDAIAAPRFPVNLMPSDLLVVFEKTANTDKNEANFELQLKCLDQKTIKADMSVNFNGKRFARNRIFLPAFELNKEGKVIFEVFDGKKRVASHKVLVYEDNSLLKK